MPWRRIGRLDVDDAVVEVDEHHAVGDDALAADRDVLEGGDRALLPEHRLRADPHLALVRADLAAVADPRPAPEVHRRRRGRSRTSRPGRRTRSRPCAGARASAAAATPSARSAARTCGSASRAPARSAGTRAAPPCSGGGSPRGGPAGADSCSGSAARSTRGINRARPATLRARVRSPGAADPRRAAARRRPPRAGARDHARRVRRPARLGAGARGLPGDRQGADRRADRRTGRRQVDADRRAHQGAPRPGPVGRRALDRPVLAVHARRAARRSHPPDATISSTPASSSARWPTAARSADSARPRSRPRC